MRSTVRDAEDVVGAGLPSTAGARPARSTGVRASPATWSMARLLRVVLTQQRRQQVNGKRTVFLSATPAGLRGSRPHVPPIRRHADPNFRSLRAPPGLAHVLPPLSSSASAFRFDPDPARAGRLLRQPRRAADPLRVTPSRAPAEGDSDPDRALERTARDLHLCSRWGVVVERAGAARHGIRRMSPSTVTAISALRTPASSSLTTIDPSGLVDVGGGLPAITADLLGQTSEPRSERVVVARGAHGSFRLAVALLPPCTRRR